MNEDVDAVVKAVGDMNIFPGENLGSHYDETSGKDRDATLNEFMENTFLSEKWPDLLHRAAVIAVNTLSKKDE